MLQSSSSVTFPKILIIIFGLHDEALVFILYPLDVLMRKKIHIFLKVGMFLRFCPAFELWWLNKCLNHILIKFRSQCLWENKFPGENLEFRKWIMLFIEFKTSLFLRSKKVMHRNFY